MFQGIYIYPEKYHTFSTPPGVGDGTVISPDCGYRYFSVPYISHNPALVSDPHTCISAVSVGSTHLDEFSGGRIVLLIYIQCGAGSGTVACRRFQGILTASAFLRVSAHGTGCAFVIPRIRGTPNAPVRARRPDTRQVLHGHAINCGPVHHYLFLSVILRMRKITCQKCTPAGPESVKKRGYGVYPMQESEPFTWLHSHSLCQNSSRRFWRVCWGFVPCFTRFPSETRSGRLSGARNEALCSIRAISRYKKAPQAFHFCVAM